MTSDHGAARAALSECFRSHQALVHGLVFDRCGNSAIAEEITAQTFEAAARRFASGNGHEVTPGWLTTVARRRLVDYWRHLSATHRATERLGHELRRRQAAAGAPIDDRLSEALGALSERQRIALTLRYVDGWPVSDLADSLGITYLAAESLLARSRRALHETIQMADLGAEDEENSA